MNKAKNNIREVHVVNFPKKDIWDKSQIIVTIISLILAFVSTALYIHEIKKCPDLYVSVFSPTPALDKTIFEFGDDSLSKPLEFDVSLHNKGDKKSESLTKLIFIFDSRVEISLKSQGLWEENEKTQNFKTFHYLKDDIVVTPDSNRPIGEYILQIPKQTNPLLFAMFVLEGDFKRKTGLIYYDYSNEKYNVVHYTNPHRATELWNQHLDQAL